MSKLSDNLNRQRKLVGMKVLEVKEALAFRGIHVSESAVGHWFNGTRQVRKMEHLKALCEILQTDLNSLTGDDIEISEGPVAVTIAREVDKLSAEQQEAILAMIRTMRR